jgi:glutaredoxin 3
MDCHAAKEFFRRHNIPFSDYSMADKGNREKLTKLVGRVATPTVVINGEIMIGFEDNKAKIAELLGITEP